MAGAAEEWGKRVRRLEKSGLSLRRFAEREGLKAGSLSLWKWKLRQEQDRRGAVAVRPVKFVELQTEPAGVAVAQPFEVELRSGRRVRVAAGFDAGELARLVVVLEEARA
jgi:hypothetical protein